MRVLPSAFDLPDHLIAKADPALIAVYQQHFAAIAASLEETIAELSFGSFGSFGCGIEGAVEQYVAMT